MIVGSDNYSESAGRSLMEATRTLRPLDFRGNVRRCDPVLLETLAVLRAEYAAGDLTRLQSVLGALAYRLSRDATERMVGTVLGDLDIEPRSFLPPFASEPKPTKRKNDRAARMHSSEKIPEPDQPPPGCLF